MARTNPRYYDLSQTEAPRIDLRTGRVRSSKGAGRLTTPGEYQIPQQRGQHVLRGVKTSKGTRDLVVDQAGNVKAVLGPGTGAKVRRGAGGRVVVGLSAPGGAAAPGASRGAAPPRADNATTFNYKFNPNKATLDARFGADGYTVTKVGKTWVVTRKAAAAGGGQPDAPPDPYADYPFIKSYLSGMDTGYTKLQDYFKNTLLPNVTQGTTALAGLSKSVSGAYQGMINNYAGSAGNVASAITTPQVAGSQGGTVTAPNQNALGAAQSLAATAKTGHDLAAGYQSTLDQLGAEKISASALSYVANYSSGLLSQYATKKNDEMLKMNMWIAEQKSAAAAQAHKDAQDSLKNDIALRGQDITTQNALIMSGDRQAAIDATTRGQDTTAATARAGQRATTARANAAAARAGQLTDAQAAAKGFLRAPAKAGPKNQAVIAKTAITSSDTGTKWYKPGGSSSGGSSGGSGGKSVVGEPQLRSQFLSGWTGKPGGVMSDGTTPDPTKPATKPTWTANKLKQAIDWIMSRRANFPKVTKTNASQLRQFLNGIEGLSGTDIDQIINGAKARW